MSPRKLARQHAPAAVRWQERLRSAWQCHSLSIVLGYLTVSFWLTAPMVDDTLAGWWFPTEEFKEGKQRVYDFVANLGHDCGSVLILNLLAMRLVEKARPESQTNE